MKFYLDFKIWDIKSIYKSTKQALVDIAFTDLVFASFSTFELPDTYLCDQKLVWDR